MYPARRTAVPAPSIGSSAAIAPRSQIRGPVGVGSVRLQLQGDPANPSLQLETSDGRKIESQAAWDELEARLGAPLPAGSLRYWMLGLAAPGEHQWREPTSDGVVTLEQGGWRIDYQRFSTEPGARVPVKMSCKQRRGARAHRRRPLAARAMTSAALAWPAPAKLNLCLHIVGRRADGYHLLQSAMQFVDLCDELRFHERPTGTIERIAGPAEIPAESDIVVKAARALATGRDVPGVGIELDETNSGAGWTRRRQLRRGDRARRAESSCGSCACRVDELARIGLTLGADVPFFVRGSAAWAEGVGERLTPVRLPGDAST